MKKTKITIDKINYFIPPISQLSVADYMKVIDKTRYINLISYISALSGREIDSAEVSIETSKINILERTLLDVNNPEKFDKLEVKNLYGDLIVKSIYKNTFGSKYFYNLYRNSYDNKDIGIIELSIYALAIMLSEKPGFEDVEDIYQDLLGENWMVVVPIGFFLSNQLYKKKKSLMIFLTLLILKFNLRLKRLQSLVGMRTI